MSLETSNPLPLRRSGEIQEHGSTIGLNSDPESKEAAAVPFGFDSLRDQGNRLSRRCKLQTQPVGEFLATFGTPRRDPSAGPLGAPAAHLASTYKRLAIRSWVEPPRRFRRSLCHSGSRTRRPLETAASQRICRAGPAMRAPRAAAFPGPGNVRTHPGHPRRTQKNIAAYSDQVKLGIV